MPIVRSALSPPWGARSWLMKSDPGLHPMPRPHHEAGPQLDRSALQFLATANIATTGAVEFFPSDAVTCGSSRRTAQAIRLVKSAFQHEFRCSVETRPGGIAVICHGASESEILRLCSAVEQKLETLRDQPLTAKMVEEILSITPHERLRWSKDGRLPTAGHAFFSQGKKQVRLFEYAPHTIRELAAQPARIAEWREAAGGAGPVVSQFE